MYIFLTVLIIVISILIMLVVLVQNPKGGGLGAGFGGGASNNMMGGVKQTTNFLEKATWYLAIALFVFSIASNAFLPDQAEDQGQGDELQIEKTLGE